ncbi:hypothetical protein OIU91_06105 [Streptomyces sp. NBC_01456]|uniref:DUF6907 domain-containing protein n=1 Tax=unclassified Streptomyces TaxID=2593676 RepID=UPI002E31F630|nr:MULTISPECIES: hypothetical protein [unclassified Streptomyces]
MSVATTAPAVAVSTATPVVPVQPSTPQAASHPTPCPAWCKDRCHVAGHHFGPTATWHWSPQYVLGNPRPLSDDSPVILTAELSRGDEGDGVGEAVLYVQGMTDIDLSAAEADIFIAQAQAFVDTLRVLRAQMG